jgi:ribosomal protein S3
MRLHRTADELVPFDRDCMRSWQQTVYCPHQGYGRWNHYAPYLVQGLKMKQYLDGYFEGKAYTAKPLIYRSVAGNLVRLFVHNHSNSLFDFDAINKALEHVFGQFQGPGTSGRSRDINEQEGRVKTRLDVIEVPNVMYHAELLAQHVAAQLKQNTPTNAIFDRLTKLMDAGTPRRASDLGVDELAVAGFRIRIKGRPRGEEMAVKKDFIHGSCPKRDADVLMDFGKCDVKLRSGMVGVKAWVHFQRPHLSDERGDASDVVFPSLLATDRDYDPAKVKEEMAKRDQCETKGLWNVQSSSDPHVASLVATLRELHKPDYPDQSRFIW